ncbi:MAG TPA: PLD nuclease N-terminal domain-containing protein [Leadbetterella sp.]|nr:PLD nuclease N-terminal domain-containing protein [Leadbetterella sp.]
MSLLFLGNLGGTEIFILFFLILPIIFWVIAIVDLVQRQFQDQTNKIVWALVILLIPFLGSLLYLLIGRKGGVKG